MNDTERIDWLEKRAREGGCPTLVNDDNGHWAVVEDGMQNLPSGDDPGFIATMFLIEAYQWCDSIREAIDVFIYQAVAADE